jgi:hypothetical protein
MRGGFPFPFCFCFLVLVSLSLSLSPSFITPLWPPFSFLPLAVSCFFLVFPFYFVSFFTVDLARSLLFGRVGFSLCRLVILQA